MVRGFIVWIKSLFVKDWRAHMRRWSVKGLALLATLQAAWLGLDPSIKAGLPENFISWVNLGLTLATLFGAFLTQHILTEEKPDG